MPGLSRRWAGALFGTNTGNIYCELAGEDVELKVRLRVMDQLFGLVLYEGYGSFDGSNFRFTAKPIQADPNVKTAPIRASGELNSKGSIAGDWESELGTGGTFLLHPHDSATVGETANELTETLHTENRPLGAIRLFRSDFHELVAAIRKDFKVGQLFITFSDRKSLRTMPLEQFLEASKNLATIDYLRLNVQEKETTNLNRIAVVELNSKGGSAILVQGGQESWVRGEADFLKSVVDRGLTRTITSIKKFGLNVNGLLLLVGIAALPELTFGRRLGFLAILFVIMAVIMQLHKAFVSNAKIFMNEERPRSLQVYSEQAISVVIATVAGTLAAAAYGALSGKLSLALGALAGFFTPNP
ncbi:hypothetical protein [Mesorhizobium sp. ES1-1]|uniref:hypothetical protein n=1 Tax=Mesorhizobium sp. ES1-1 TaxID=2876629 RepID=UPI001CCA0C60|nr:hypothetical protein [Mesorhizobium sp. ES1-1]MBZ9677451.1 hypothetical protein [Mesorhizobium sp. ES1-1]